MVREADKTRLVKILREKKLGKLGMRYVLSIAGDIPVAGGAISGLGNDWAETDQANVNEALVDWVTSTDADLGQVIEKLDSLLQEASEASLTVLLTEMFGDENAERLMANRPTSIHAILHPSTVAELEPFINNGLVNIRATGSHVAMGAGNKMGNALEEQKRCYGMGSGFVVSLLAATE